MNRLGFGLAGFVGLPVGLSCSTGRTSSLRPMTVRGAARSRPGRAAGRRRACVVRSAQDTMVLTEENVELALTEAKATLETIFDSPENNEVGITGDVEFVAVDGPAVVLRLKGRFWHKREDVLNRVANYLQSRIPEIFEVEIEDPRQLLDTEEEARQG